MDDVSDMPFRLLCKEHGADLLYTEFIQSKLLVRGGSLPVKRLEFDESERPIGIQLYGASEHYLMEAVAIAESVEPDFIDINCGCWVKKVALREAGAGLLRDLNKFEAIVKSVVRGTNLPVTVKTRLGWDEKSIVILDVARMLEQAGVQALAVHCRTRNQGHNGDADWSWLERLKAAVSMPIIGNGDVVLPEDAPRMFETGVDGVMIGRGAIQNPWLFREAKALMAGKEAPPRPGIEERVQTCLRHLKLAVAFRGERNGAVTFRKYYAAYFKGLPKASKLRADLMGYETVAEVEERLLRYRDELSASAAGEAAAHPA
jgi:nifR3 family TIM-barrel protein